MTFLKILIIASLLSTPTLFGRDEVFAINLTTGSLNQGDSGTVSFTIVEGSGEDEVKLPVSITIEEITDENGLSATAKAQKIVDFFDDNEDWRAIRNGSEITFQRRSGAEFVRITAIENFEDTTSEKERFTSISNLGGDFLFALDNSLASGFDTSGSTSFVEVTTTLGSTNIPISPGDSSTFLINSLFNDLQNEGVDINLISTLSFQIIDSSPNGFMEFQITDTNIGISGASAINLTSVPENSSLLTIISVGAIGVQAILRNKIK